jgi:hypothetical protein
MWLVVFYIHVIKPLLLDIWCTGWLAIIGVPVHPTVLLVSVVHAVYRWVGHLVYRSVRHLVYHQSVSPPFSPAGRFGHLMYRLISHLVYRSMSISYDDSLIIHCVWVLTPSQSGFKV